MCFLRFASDALGHATALSAARRGILFKRSAYNFVCLAHSDADIDRTAGVLDEVLREVSRG